jgi:ATP-dependent Clp protease adaptor protein ClpS
VNVHEELPHGATGTDTLIRDKQETERAWAVVVWDDPVTPMAVVTLVFKKVFGYSESKATQLMLQVHHEGRSAVWSGSRDRAEGYCVKLHTFGLLATVEQA